LSGAVTLYLTVLITREFGGGRLAQFIAVLCYFFALIFMRINLLFQPVTFNLFFYVLAVYLFIQILKNEKPKYWIYLGIITGFGILNKYTMLLFAFGVLTGLTLTPYRRLFRNKWLWISGSIALIIWLPNLFWQHSQGWPFFEHMRVLSERQLTNVQPLNFVLIQLLMNLHALPVWILGYFVFQFSKKQAMYRPIAYIYLSSFIVLLLLSGKIYYLAPAYPMLFAAGAVIWEMYIRKWQKRWVKMILIIFIVYNGIVYLPIGLPVLSTNNMISYFKFAAKYLGAEGALRWETGEIHEIPQDYADMQGWEQMVNWVAKTYHALPEEEKDIAAIFAANYGQNGAIDYYNDKYNLPRCINKGNSYWLWGYRDYDGKVSVIVGLTEDNIQDFFAEIEPAGTFYHPHARESGSQILIARKPKMSMAKIWQILKQYRY